MNNKRTILLRVRDIKLVRLFIGFVALYAMFIAIMLAAVGLWELTKILYNYYLGG